MPSVPPIPGLVSVVIPAFNRERHVGQAVRSALGQSGIELEILVVDDASTDGTSRVIDHEFGSERRVRFIRQDHGGVSKARNRGIAEARGEFIAFLDSDDFWLEGKLALQLRAMGEFPSAVLSWTDMDAIDSEGLVKPRYLRTMYKAYRWYPTPDSLFNQSSIVSGVAAYHGSIYSPMFRGNLIHTSTVLLRSDAAGAAGVFREDLQHGGEDYDYYVRVTKLGPVVYLDRSTIRYRIGADDALTHRENNSALAEAFLGTITATLDRDRAGILLSEREIRKTLAEAYAWRGRAGGRSATSSILKSLGLDPLQPRLLVFLTRAIMRTLLFERVWHDRHSTGLVSTK